jgi:glutamate carboxypeptidase
LREERAAPEGVDLKGAVERKNPLLEWAEAHLEETIALIGEFVECYTPSEDAGAIQRFNALFRARVAGFGEVREFDGGHLQCRFDLPGGAKNGRDGRILALGHLDVVKPHVAFRVGEGRVWGRGVFDMKGGLAFLLMAVRALRELEAPVKREVLLQLNADEESGSLTSRAITEEAARGSVAVLVMEPSNGLDGKLKTERKGLGHYAVVVHGRAAHAGLDFESGANAIVELARQIDRIAGFTDISRGVTVNTGVIRGGEASNTVPAEARADVDVRVTYPEDAARVEAAFRSLTPVDSRCTIAIEGGMNRPPMERTPGNRELFEKAREIARAELGIELEGSAVGGGSDGSFTSALGVPTLDGIGAVGEGAHAANESILIGRIADRVALAALLLARV